MVGGAECVRRVLGGPDVHVQGGAEFGVLVRRTGAWRNRMVAVRDSKNPDGGVLAFSSQRWTAFTRRIKDSMSGLV